MALKAVIFDLDGVLFSSAQAWKNITFTLLSKLDIPITSELLAQIEKREIYEALEFLSQTYQQRGVSEVFFDFAPKMFEEQTILSKGAKEWIEKLKRLNIACCIATASLPIFYQKIFNRYGLKFDCVANTYEVGKSKESAEVYLACTLGNLPSECLVIEDSKIGYNSAKMQGFRAILVENGNVDWRRVDEECFKYCRK